MRAGSELLRFCCCVQVGGSACVSRIEAGLLRPIWSLWMDRRRLRTPIPTTKASCFALSSLKGFAFFPQRVFVMVLCVPAGELYITAKAYKAEQEDEISLELGETIEVIHKLLDGWWVVRYDMVSEAAAAGSSL